ncbi:MAG TPA: hypothetical protein PLY70_20115, partial [Saprospiraceae bacterium]|nr:hypothetical protein [Saprospiraceae bacterium]
MRSFIQIICALLFVVEMQGQETAKYRDRLDEYKTGKDLFDKSLYLPSKYEMEEYIKVPDQPHFDKFDRLV